MIIETKFNIDDEVYYISATKVAIGYIHYISVTVTQSGEIKKEYILRTRKELSEASWSMPVSAGEGDIFSSREELVNSILKDEK